MQQVGKRLLPLDRQTDRRMIHTDQAAWSGARGQGAKGSENSVRVKYAENAGLFMYPDPV